MSRRDAVRALAAALLALGPAPAPSSAFTGNTGGSTAQFLRIGAGARALGMGEAFGPVAEGPTAIYWNPAGLAQLGRPAVSYTHVEMLGYFHHEYVAYAHPVRFLGGTIGGSATIFYQDSIDLYTNNYVQAGSFSPHSEAFAVAYARPFRIGDDYNQINRDYFEDLWNYPGTYRPLDVENELWVGQLLAGASVKLIQESIHDSHARAVAVDGGVLFRHTDLPRLALSFAFRNVGTKERFNEEYESLPAEIDFGMAYSFTWKNSRLLPALEVAVPHYGPPYAKTGIEYDRRLGINTSMALRAGYKTLSAPYLGALTGVTGGVGFMFRRIALDLAFQPMAELGEAYRIELGYRF